MRLLEHSVNGKHGQKVVDAVEVDAVSPRRADTGHVALLPTRARPTDGSDEEPMPAAALARPQRTTTANHQ